MRNGMVHAHLFGLHQKRSTREKSEITIPNALVHGAQLGFTNGKRVLCECEGCDRERWKSFHQKRIRYMKLVFAKPFPVIYLSFACFLIFLFSLHLGWFASLYVLQHVRRKRTNTHSTKHDRAWTMHASSRLRRKTFATKHAHTDGWLETWQPDPNRME